MSKRKFKWDAWDFDCNGTAYIISVDECPKREDVPAFIHANDYIPDEINPTMQVQEGWCKYQVRRDWDNGDGQPQGGYYATMAPHKGSRAQYHIKPGWFKVWIVRKEGEY